MYSWLKNTFLYRKQYKTHPNAVIIACFYNPLNSPYRLWAFQKWYRSIKHLNHRIIECLIGKDAKPQLPDSKYITRVTADNLLWHKETLLNKLIASLPNKFQYVFWLDTDVLFTNQNWLVESVEQLQHSNIIQPFEYCVHLKKGELKPDFSVEANRTTVSDPKQRHPQLWRSFCANYATSRQVSEDRNYDRHGHVGFAWGARREALGHLPTALYDRALIGGADHIMAHAAAGQIPHECIRKSFTDDIDSVEQWSEEFYAIMQGKIGYTSGDLYHLWHGDIEKRQYLKRIKDFTKETKTITHKNSQGLYVKADNNAYMEEYYRHREAVTTYATDFQYEDEDFYRDMGYTLQNFINTFLKPGPESPVSLPTVDPISYSNYSQNDSIPSAVEKTDADKPSDIFEVNPVRSVEPISEFFSKPEPRTSDLPTIFSMPAMSTPVSSLSETFSKPAERTSDLGELFSRSVPESENFS